MLRGTLQAKKLFKKIQPDVVFSKGGFVTVPVLIASKLSKVPAIIHESDFTPGLANKITMPFAQKVCVTFPETMKNISQRKAIYTGSPIREEILHGNKQKGYEITGFTSKKTYCFNYGWKLRVCEN